MRSSKAGRRTSARCPATRNGPTARAKACLPKARIASSCCSAASCRRWTPPRGTLLPQLGPEHQLPGRRDVARRDDGVAARHGRHRSGHAEVADVVGRQRRRARDQGTAVSPARRRRQVGELHRRRRRQRQHHRDVDAVGQDAAAPALRVHQPVRSREARVGRRRQHAGDLQVHATTARQLVQTIGTPEQEGADATHFNRPTFIDWLPDGTFFVSDGYTGTRVAKFDKDGKFLMDWGIKGNPPNETRPGYMNNVHGVAVDPTSRRVFVNDRNNHRVQVFDENGKFLYAWQHRRGSVEPASALHRRRPEHLDLRSQHAQAAQVRPARATCSTRGARSACSPARCGACTA